MAAIGRLGVTRSLKQMFELTGGFSPELGEGIVPTVQLADIADTPFDSVVHWTAGHRNPGVAAQYPWFVIVPSVTMPKNGWISIDTIWAAGALANILIFPAMFADLPVLTQQQSPRNSRQGGGITLLQRVSEVAIFASSVVTAPSADAMAWDSTKPNFGPVRFHLSSAGSDLSLSSNSGALAIVGDTVASLMQVAVAGRVHLTSAR